jgi:hypothetical protein
MKSPIKLNHCNICNSSTFSPGPQGRIGLNGSLPHCMQCGALERHRAVRSLFDHFSPDYLNWRNGLQISQDPALDPNTFKSYEISIFENDGIDLRSIDRQDSMYDFITLSHVIESIDDDIQSMHELIRVSTDHGLIHLVLADPLSLEKSVDYDAAIGPYEYHHRYGRDFAQKFELDKAHCKLTLVNSLDVITGTFTPSHFITKSEDSYLELHKQLSNIEAINGVERDSAQFHFLL